MQIKQELEPVTKLIDTQSYKLVANFIRYGRQRFNLSANATYIMITLLNFFNPKKKYVFPKHETIANQTGLSVSTVKRGINELVKAKLLLKTRKQTCNIYAFTSLIFELSERSERAIKIGQGELSLHEHDKKNNIKQQHGGVVFINKDLRGAEEEVRSESRTAVSTSSNVQDIPSIIAGNPNIKNPIAYWKSLKPAIKEEYLLKQKELDAEQAKREEFRKIQEEEKRKEEELIRKIDAERELPLNERFTKEGAINIIKSSANLINSGFIKRGLPFDLAEAFNLDIESIISSPIP